MIPLYHRLKIAWEKKLRSTRPARDCAETGEELEQSQAKLLDYNRNYRLSDGSRHRVRKFFLRILAVPAPIYYRPQNICRKISRGTKRACDFVAACWRSAKAGLLRALAPFAPVLHRLGIIWRK